MTVQEAARGALEALGGPTDDDRVGTVAQHLRIDPFSCGECGSPRERAVVIDASGTARKIYDAGCATGYRPMTPRDLVLELCRTRPRDMGFKPA